MSSPGQDTLTAAVILLAKAVFALASGLRHEARKWSHEAADLAWRASKEAHPCGE